MKSMSEMTHDITDSVKKMVGRLTGRGDHNTYANKPSGQASRLTEKK